MAMWLGLAGAVALTLTSLWFRIGTHLVTVVHEAGHALAVSLSDGRVVAIRIDADGGGATHSTGSGEAEVPVTLAGYVAPSAVGLGLLALLHAGAVLGALMLLLGALVVVTALVRNAFGVGLLVAGGLVLYFAVRYGTPGVQAVIVATVAWTLLLGSVRDAVTLWRGQTPGSDASALAGATRIPSPFWSGLFVVLTTVAAAYAAWLVLQVW